MTRVRKHLVAGLVLTLYTSPIFADDNRNNLRAEPFAFVGERGDCGEITPGTPYPAGSNIVTSAWLGGMGLPDNGGPNTGPDPTDSPNKRDPHLGLLISKNGPTPTCASAGARIVGVRGKVVTLTTTLGFDYRNGGHCSGGAPRFNVAFKRPDNTEGFAFVGGCGNAVGTPAPQDEANWTRVRFVLVANGIPMGSQLRTVTLLHDEGTDVPTITPTSDNSSGIGLAVVDNVAIDEKLITRGEGIAPNPKTIDDDDHDRDGRRNDRDDDDDDDGWADADDNDDDDDSYVDSRDSDHDNDGIPNRHDRSSTRETMTVNSVELGPGESTEQTITAEPGTTHLLVELEDGALLVTDVVNSLGVVLNTSLPGVGAVSLNVPISSSGAYVIRTRNIGITPAASTSTIVSRRNW